MLFTGSVPRGRYLGCGDAGPVKESTLAALDAFTSPSGGGDAARDTGADAIRATYDASTAVALAAVRASRLDVRCPSIAGVDATAAGGK